MSSRRLRSGGTLHFEGIDPEHQIFAEGSLDDHLFEIAVGRTDNADVDVGGLVVTEATDVAGLQDS